MRIALYIESSKHVPSQRYVKLYFDGTFSGVIKIENDDLQEFTRVLKDGESIVDEIKVFS